MGENSGKTVENSYSCIGAGLRGHMATRARGLVNLGRGFWVLPGVWVPGSREGASRATKEILAEQLVY